MFKFNSKSWTYNCSDTFVHVILVFHSIILHESVISCVDINTYLRVSYTGALSNIYNNVHIMFDISLQSYFQCRYKHYSVYVS